MRAFHGARQGTRSASSNQAPGFHDPTAQAKGMEAIHGVGFHKLTPVEAAATMHDDLADMARQLTQGRSNVPFHPATEGSDKQGYGGDAALHDPTGQGRGV